MLYTRFVQFTVLIWYKPTLMVVVFRFREGIDLAHPNELRLGSLLLMVSPHIPPFGRVTSDVITAPQRNANSIN